MLRGLIILSTMAVGAGVMPAPNAAAQVPAVQQPKRLRGLDDIKPGTKLRAATLENPLEPVEGRFISVTGSAFTLQLRGSQQRELNISQLLGVDEAYPDRKRGALVGVLPGIVGVYVWDFFGPHPHYADQSRRYRENAIALVASCGIGAVIGAVRGWERWRPLQISAR